ncbi:MAG: sugar nucleotide-binding protein [Phycisphaerales bacterium]
MRVLVTGANGYLGALLSSELEKIHDVIKTSRSDPSHADALRLDITERSATRACISEAKPDLILHAAAIASVAACEATPEDAMRTNVGGTENVVEAANACGARVALISSLAARDPSTVYGRTKHEAEVRVRAVDAGYEILQLSMTFGLSPNRTSHRPFNKLLNTLRTGSPDTYDDYWTFQPTGTQHLLEVLEQLLREPFRGRTLPVTTAETCTMHRLASDVLAPRSVKSGIFYPDRKHLYVDPSALTSHGFSSRSYASLVSQLRSELAQEA